MKLYLLALAALLTGCGTPFSVSAGFFGASATVNFPNGIQQSVPVKTSTVVTAPALLVPLGSPLANLDTVAVAAKGGTIAATVVEAPVDAPVLAVPAKAP